MTNQTIRNDWDLCVFIKIKEYRGNVLNNCIFTGLGPCADFQLDINNKISANSVGKINTAKSLNRAES